MLFSVVIPTFNRAGLLPITLESVFAQSWKSYEVIVVDDGSTDHTRTYLASLGDRVRVLHQSQRGPGAARNAGVAAATGEYVAFLDSDDRWFPWTLQAMRDAIEAAGRPTMIIGRMVEFSADASLASVVQTELRFDAFADFISSAPEPIAGASNASVIKRTALLDVGGFTEVRVNCEDHDLALRLGTFPGFAVVREPVTVAWRRHPGTLTTDMSLLRAGAEYLIEQEQNRRYPGGNSRATERRKIISQHVRPVAVGLLAGRDTAAALGLYAAMFGWDLRIGRWRYLLWFPFAWLRATVRSRGWPSR